MSIKKRLMNGPVNVTFSLQHRAAPILSEIKEHYPEPEQSPLWGATEYGGPAYKLGFDHLPPLARQFADDLGQQLGLAPVGGFVKCAEPGSAAPPHHDQPGNLARVVIFYLEGSGQQPLDFFEAGVKASTQSGVAVSFDPSEPHCNPVAASERRFFLRLDFEHLAS